MAEYVEGPHTGEFLMSEAAGSRSRETGVAAASQAWAVGQIVGQVTTGALSATAAARAGNTGDGTIGAITVAAGTKIGAWVLTILEPATNAGSFALEDPDGETAGNGDVAAAASIGGLGFTLADGATDFAAGDQFVITVVAADAAAQGQYKTVNLAATDGTQVAAAIAYDAVTTGAGETRSATLIARDAEVNGNLIAYPAGASADDIALINADLADLGIIVR